MTVATEHWLAADAHYSFSFVYRASAPLKPNVRRTRRMSVARKGKPMRIRVLFLAALLVPMEGLAHPWAQDPSGPQEHPVQQKGRERCPHDLFEVAEQPDAPLRLTVEPGECERHGWSATFHLTNIGSKPIKGYSVAIWTSFELREGLWDHSCQCQVPPVQPVESQEFKQGRGYDKTRVDGGAVREVRVKLSRVRFADDTTWVADNGDSPPPAEDCPSDDELSAPPDSPP